MAYSASWKMLYLPSFLPILSCQSFKIIICCSLNAKKPFSNCYNYLIINSIRYVSRQFVYHLLKHNEPSRIKIGKELRIIFGKHLKKGCELEFSRCFLINFTNTRCEVTFFATHFVISLILYEGSTLINFGFLIKKGFTGFTGLNYFHSYTKF